MPAAGLGEGQGVEVPNFRLDGSVAVVTGSGSGIGKALALGLSQAGAHAVLTELPGRRESAEKTARMVRSIGKEALVVELDVTRAESIEQMVTAVRKVFGRIDVLVNNAGVIVRKAALEVTEDEWDRVLNTNLKGAFFVSQAVARLMTEQGGGKIINIASINGIVGSPERASYTASKAGLINLTRTLAAEWAEHNINVNAIGPTYLLTPLTEAVFEDPHFRETYFRRQPIRRVGRPEDLIGAAVYLASSASDLVTGHTLMVDGGWTAV